MRALMRRAAILVTAAAGAGLLAAGIAVAMAGPAAAQSTVLYAAVTATGIGDCSDAADACTLSTALGSPMGPGGVAAGGTIELVTPGDLAHYVGNWEVTTTGTTASAPVTIEAAQGLSSQPVLDGNNGASNGCSTASCDGPVLAVPGGEYVALSGITIADGNNTALGNVTSFTGGGLANAGTVTITGCRFTGNTAPYGGAIDSGDLYYGGGSGSLTVTASTFTGNAALSNGGAIDSGANGGGGSVTVRSSTFTGNTADSEYGGAIDNGNAGGGGTVYVATSTFSGNTAFGGGAISSGDGSGSGTVTVATSTFSGNTASGNGGAIDSGDDFGGGTVYLLHSTFSGNTASGSGGAIDGGDDYGGGTVTVAADVFDGSIRSGSICNQAGGSWTDLGYNAGDDISCFNAGTGDAAAPLGLGPLADNGGPTQTMLPLAGNNKIIGLIPAGTNVNLGSGPVPLCPTIDQRGYPNAAGTNCDAGAVQTTGTLTLSTTANPAKVTLGTSVTALQDQAVLSGGNDPTGTITFTLYDPSNKPVYTDDVTVSGDGTYSTAAGDSPGGFTPATAGTYQWDATYSGDAHNNKISDTNATAEQVVVNPAIQTTATTVTSSENPSTYGDSVTFTATISPSPAGAGTVTFTADGGTTLCSAVAVSGNTATCSISSLPASGSPHAITASYSGVTGFTASSGGLSQTVNKAVPSCSVAGYTATYDATAHTATGSCTGVSGGTLSGLDLSGTTHTGAGTYSDSWTFTDSTGNYTNASGTVTDTISPATPTCTVIGYAATYDATAHTAAGSCTGVTGETLSGLDLSGTTHTGAGTYFDVWTFVDVTGNYNDASGTVTDTIGKATPTCTVTGYTVTYDATAHTAAGSCAGISGETLSGLDLSGTTHTHAGLYSDSWTFTDVAGNYQNASGTVADTINLAAPTCSVTGYTVTYDATAHAATGSCTGVSGETLSGLDLSGTSHTGAGTYSDSWAFSGNTGNYLNASGTVTDTITRAVPTCSVTGYTVTYDATAHAATGACTGVSGETLSGLDLSATAHTDAGTYPDSWAFTDSTGNYKNASGTVTDTISPASAKCTVTGYTVTYDATAHTAAGSCAGVAGEDLSSGLNLTGTTHTHAGEYPDKWTFTAATGNYQNASGTVTDTINLAAPTCTVTGYTATYDATAHTATGSCTGVGGETLSGLNLSGTSHTGAGTYSDSWAFSGNTGNYLNAAGTLTDTINKATVHVDANPASKTYGDSDPAPGATLRASDFQGSDTASTSGITGNPNCSIASHSQNAGTYTGVISCGPGTLSAANYTFVAGHTADLTISQATLTVTADSKSITYGDPLPAFTYQVTGDTSAILTGSATCAASETAGSPPGPAGAYPITCTQGTLSADGNYKFSFVGGTLTISKRPATLGYTGGMFFSTGSPSATSASVTLQATITPAAGGSPDLTKAGPVKFLLYKSTNLTMTTPDAMCVATTVSGTGTATCTISSLGVDNWTVVVQEPSNGYFTALDSDPAVITVYQPLKDKFATGGGWITDPSPNVSSQDNHGNFGLTVRYKSGTTTPSGQAVYVFRGRDGYNYVIKSNSWTGGGLSFGTNTASFSGKCNVTAIDPSTGLAVTGIGGGNYTYRVDVIDNGATGDTYAISVYTPTGTLYHQAGTTSSQLSLGGGNIVVHTK